MDADIVVWLNGFVGRYRPLDEIMQAFVSDYLVPVAGSLLLVGLWFHGGSDGARLANQIATITGALAIGLANALVGIVNTQVSRARPFDVLDLDLLFYEASDSSFPANAAVVGFALAAVIFLRNRALGVVLFVLASLWGLARVYAGVHYASDIAGGALMGVGAALVSLLVMRVGSFLVYRVLRVLRYLYLA